MGHLEWSKWVCGECEWGKGATKNVSSLSGLGCRRRSMDSPSAANYSSYSRNIKVSII